MNEHTNDKRVKVSDYRYERKFFVEGLSANEVKAIIKIHPFQFSEIFYERNINNIYFDSSNLDCLNDNIIGLDNRMKVRVRWYGELYGEKQKSTLELKIRKGALGKKHSMLVDTFKFGIGDSIQLLSAKLKYYGRKLNVDLSDFNAKLINQYKRSYFLSHDKKIRATVDSDQLFGRIENNLMPTFIKDPNSVILELKYDNNIDVLGREASNLLPFRLSKSSKYVRGLTLNS